MPAKSNDGSSVKQPGTPAEIPADTQPLATPETETDFGFFLKLKSSAGETIVKIRSKKEFVAGNESLNSDKTISLSGSKLRQVLEDNKITLDENIAKRLLNQTSINLPAFFYNTGGTTPGNESFFFAIELTFYQDGIDQDGGLLTALTGVKDLGKFLDIEAVGVAVFKGVKAVDAKKKFFASVEQPAQLPDGTPGNKPNP